MNHSNTIIQVFDEILNEKKCNELCRRCKFIKRSSSKIQGAEFIKIMILPAEGLTTDSLSGLCKRMREFNPSANISAQALCKRINNASSCVLMKSLLGELLFQSAAKLINKHPNLNFVLGKFNNVYLEDSSVAILNNALVEEYPSVNKNKTLARSQVKIDLIYEVLRGRMVESNIYSGTQPDQSLAGQILKHLKPGDLIIRDLGYFALKIFKAIAENGAYWVSRLQPGVIFFTDKKSKIPLDIGKYLQENHLDKNIIELNGFLGEERVESRIILYRQPQDIVNKRSRIANKNAKRNGRTISKSKKNSLKYAIFVTNIPKEMISAEIIGTIYRLRWEIELIFKRWKSQLNIDHLPGINKNRIDCLIWGRLCMVVIIELITGYVSEIAQRHFRLEISEVKLIEYLLRDSGLKTAMGHGKLESFFCELEKDIRRMLLKNKRKLKTMRERILKEESYYNTQVFINQQVA